MCENTDRPGADAAGASPSPRPSTAPHLLTYPSKDISRRLKIAGAVVKTASDAIDHKVHGDSHDSTGLDLQRLGVDLDNARGRGADSGL